MSEDTAGPDGGPKPKSASTIKINKSQGRLNYETFPDPPRPGQTPPTTIRNVAYLMDRHGIKARYNVVKKKLEITVPHAKGTDDNLDNVALTQIVSLVSLHGMSTGLVAPYVCVIADQNAYNPVADWIESKPWDGTSRLEDFYHAVEAQEDYPEDLKRTLLRKWLLSAVAAALMPRGFKSRGVLTFQGRQGLGKTSFILSLVDDPELRDAAVKIDHHIDGSKDAQMTALAHWIVEIGELDSTFKRDVARLKGFITANADKIRRPYDKFDSEYPRRTVFAATVNDAKFLVDSTGNSRFWTIPVTGLNYNHGIDMQQLYAELAVAYDAGEQWWLTGKEEAGLAERNERHQVVSAVREQVLDVLDPDRSADGQFMTCSEVLKAAGYERPTNPQTKECGALLRELVGDSRRIHGRDKWRVFIVDPDEPQPPRTREKNFD